MYREAIEILRKWRVEKNRQPLIIRGARQVGKTWLVEEFGKKDFKDFVKINFEKTPSMIQIFEGDLDPKRIIRLIEISSGKKITANDTLLFFDEIQDAPRALTALKYFAEEAPEYPLIAAGSLLGIAEHEGISFPVGKVNFMNLYPMSFKEFLLASGEEGLAELLSDDFSLIDSFYERYTEKLREYMLVGGMPAVVKNWVENHKTDLMRKIQEDIIESYLSDLSKHAPAETAVRCRQIIMSVPSQLAKENKKFMYSTMRSGLKSKEYEASFAWLESCRIINVIHRVTTPNIPLSAYEEKHIFKLFIHDTGLLSALSRIDPQIMIAGDSVFDMFKGSLTEQYVLQELIASSWAGITYYSNERSTAEIDFLIEYGKNIVPLEVKSGINTKAKSLRAYHDKYQPHLSLRASLLPYKKQDWLINIPLYGVSKIREICEKELH